MKQIKLKIFKKAFTLAELMTVATIVLVLAAGSLLSYRYYIKKAVIASLKSAVMANVQIIRAYKDVHGIWVTEAIEGNENLTTDEEMKQFGLSSRDFSDDFMIRVFNLDDYPHVIAREQLGKHKYNIRVHYHFKTGKLVVDELD